MRQKNKSEMKVLVGTLQDHRDFKEKDIPYKGKIIFAWGWPATDHGEFTQFLFSTNFHKDFESLFDYFKSLYENKRHYSQKELTYLAGCQENSISDLRKEVVIEPSFNNVSAEGILTIEDDCITINGLVDDSSNNYLEKLILEFMKKIKIPMKYQINSERSVKDVVLESSEISSCPFYNEKGGPPPGTTSHSSDYWMGKREERRRELQGTTRGFELGY